MPPKKPKEQKFDKFEEWRDAGFPAGGYSPIKERAIEGQQILDNPNPVDMGSPYNDRAAAYAGQDHAQKLMATFGASEPESRRRRDERFQANMDQIKANPYDPQTSQMYPVKLNMDKMYHMASPEGIARLSAQSKVQELKRVLNIPPTMARATNLGPEASNTLSNDVMNYVAEDKAGKEAEDMAIDEQLNWLSMLQAERQKHVGTLRTPIIRGNTPSPSSSPQTPLTSSPGPVSTGNGVGAFMQGAQTNQKLSRAKGYGY